MRKLGGEIDRLAHLAAFADCDLASSSRLPAAWVRADRRFDQPMLTLLSGPVAQPREGFKSVSQGAISSMGHILCAGRLVHGHFSFFAFICRAGASGIAADQILYIGKWQVRILKTATCPGSKARFPGCPENYLWPLNGTGRLLPEGSLAGEISDMSPKDACVANCPKVPDARLLEDAIGVAAFCAGVGAHHTYMSAIWTGGCSDAPVMTEV